MTTKPDYALFQAHLTLLSPLHIGTGRELLNEYDYAVYNNQTWRINEIALLDAQDVEDAQMAAILARKPYKDLLRPEDYVPGSPLFRYVIRGAARSRAVGAVLREQLKNSADQPYIPGSSLKGAFRTVLAWHAWKERGLRPEKRLLDERRAKFAAQQIEKTLLGRDPNHDLLRALQIGDSQPVKSDRLFLVNAKVLTKMGDGSPIEVEALRSETQFSLPVKIDWTLFSGWAAQAENGEFRLGGRSEWIDLLPAIARAHAQERIRSLSSWYKERKGAEKIASFYRDLENLNLNPSQFVLQLGWGGGWDSKTFGSRLVEDPQFMDWIIDNYRLSRGRREKGSLFPKSKRAAMQVTAGPQGQSVETPAAPLGWVLVELEQVK